MPNIRGYSTTPASNALVGSTNFQEGQLPSTLNDSNRNALADIKGFANELPWYDIGHTPTRTGNTTFTIPTDVTSIYTADRRLKLGDSSTLYAAVVSSSFGAGFTTITVRVDGGTALSASLSTVHVATDDPSNVSASSDFNRKRQATTSGTSTAYTATFNPPIPALVDGVTVDIFLNAATGAAPTFAPDGLTAKEMRLAGNVVIADGAFPASAMLRMTYKSSPDKWIIGGVLDEGRKGADITAANSIDLGAATGDFVDIVGNTTINAMGTARVGMERTTRTTGTPTFTYNATSMILLTGASINAEAGDIQQWRSLGSGNWLMTGYCRADGLPLANPPAESARNWAFNPEGAIFQRTAPTTDNAYAWDRWRLLLGAANAATVSQLTSGVPTGAKYAMRLTVGSGNNNKFGIFQPLEGGDIYALRGRTVTLQAQIKATAALTDVRMAIVEWTGTEDATTGDPISAWNSMGTVPTYNTGWANLNTPANLSVTTSFATYSVTATVGSSATNLGIFIWSEDTSNTQTTDILDITMVMLTAGNAAATYVPRAMAEELALCQRYCQLVLSGVNKIVGVASAYTTTNAIGAIPMPTPMRAAPTLVLSDPTHFILNGGGDVALTALDFFSSSTQAPSFDATVASGLTAASAYRMNSSNASSRMTLTAEI